MSAGKQYRRIMLGKGSMYAEEGLKGNFVAAGFLFGIDLTGKFPDEWRDFNREWIPVWLEQNPEKIQNRRGSCLRHAPHDLQRDDRGRHRDDAGPETASIISGRLRATIFMTLLLSCPTSARCIGLT